MTLTSTAIEKFNNMVRRSSQNKARDIRLDMNDAIGLMTEIANVMARLAVYEHETVQRNENITVNMDGGRLDK